MSETFDEPAPWGPANWGNSYGRGRAGVMRRILGLEMDSECRGRRMDAFETIEAVRYIARLVHPDHARAAVLNFARALSHKESELGETEDAVATKILREAADLPGCIHSSN